MDYEHTQTGWLTRWGLGLTIGVLAVALVVVAEPAARVISGAVLLVLAASWVTFTSLTVTVDARQITLRFGPGPIRKRIELSAIRTVRPVRNSWSHGWGIRLIGNGWMWNVAGLDAVELELSNGRRFRIGTDEPAALVEALERGMRRGPR